MDRRQADRIPAAIPIRIRVRNIDQFTEQHTENLSTGGLFLPSTDPQPVGTRLEIEFHFAQNYPSFTIEGEVVRSQTEPSPVKGPPGMAVRFLKVDETGRQFIERAIEVFNRRHPSERLEISGLVQEPEGDAEPHGHHAEVGQPGQDHKRGVHPLIGRPGHQNMNMFIKRTRGNDPTKRKT